MVGHRFPKPDLWVRVPLPASTESLDVNEQLENIGFYTLEDARAMNTSMTSPMWRCEVILTNFCNFSCPYCKGHEHGEVGRVKECLALWVKDGLRNIRFSGGEPTFHKELFELVEFCKANGVLRIAVSTNGSRPWKLYKRLIDAGVNDFSVSLDACCAQFGDKMAGRPNVFEKVIRNIRKLAELTYVTVGVVLTEDNIDQTPGIVQLAHDLGVADIRLITAAQYNQLIAGLEQIPSEFLEAHPLLKYRVNNILGGRNVRGLTPQDTHRCYLVMDDSILAGDSHFPCVINMREGGPPIGTVGPKMREERHRWSLETDTHKNSICKQNCLDVCIDYNNRVRSFEEVTHGEE